MRVHSAEGALLQPEFSSAVTAAEATANCLLLKLVAVVKFAVKAALAEYHFVDLLVFGAVGAVDIYDRHASTFLCLEQHPGAVVLGSGPGLEPMANRWQFFLILL